MSHKYISFVLIKLVINYICFVLPWWFRLSHITYFFYCLLSHNFCLGEPIWCFFIRKLVLPVWSHVFWENHISLKFALVMYLWENHISLKFALVMCATNRRINNSISRQPIRLFFFLFERKHFKDNLVNVW